jgi:hypothetical protein
MWNVKEAVAHQALAARPRDGRLVIPADRDDWARKQAETLITALSESSYDLVGAVDELRPPSAAEQGGLGGSSLRADTEPSASPAEQPAEPVLDAAVHAASALVVNQYRKEYPAARPQPSQDRQRGLVARVESTVASSPRLKRTVRELSSRFPAVRRLRIVAWRRLERRRAGRHA